MDEHWHVKNQGGGGVEVTVLILHNFSKFTGDSAQKLPLLNTLFMRGEACLLDLCRLYCMRVIEPLCHGQDATLISHTSKNLVKLIVGQRNWVEERSKL